MDLIDDTMELIGELYVSPRAVLLPERLARSYDAGLSGEIPAGTRSLVIARDGFVCRYCAAAVHIGEPFDDEQLHLDHVVPRAMGGPSDPDNLVVACRRCNLSKRDRPVWRSRTGPPAPLDWREVIARGVGA